MDHLLVSLLLFSLLQIFYVESRHIVKRVVEGFPAAAGQFPYQISIRTSTDNYHICGGTIIDKRFILTAGHCLKERHPSDIYIVAGTNRLSESSNKYKVEKIAHGNYDGEKHSRDISMIKLSEDILFTNLIQPLPFDTSEPPINVSMTVSGWGLKHFEDDDSPDELQYLEVKSISFDECFKLLFGTGFDEYLTEKDLCTFNKYGEGVCYGDSGGPLMYEGNLVGIVSHGIPCANGFPDIFTKVSEYYNWIEAAMIAMK